MSDTPRTDASELRSGDEPERPLGMVETDFARQLERELNAAQATIRQQQLLDEEIMRLRERVKRLEEAGDKMHWAFMHPFDEAHESVPGAWIKAKEAKP